MHRSDLIAVILSLLAIIASTLVSTLVFEAMPHIEDEMAYSWQAQAAAKGRLTLPSPANPKAFLVPFVVDYQGQRFGKYPPGWPALLALGVLLNARTLVNPLLAGAGVWLTYRLGQRLFSNTVGLLSAGLTLTSPFFLMNSGSLLSHPFGLFLSAAFVLAWLDAWTSQPTVGFEPRRQRLGLITAALCLGLLALTRPLTALGVCLPFCAHGIYLLVRGDRWTRRRLAIFIFIVLGIVGLLLVWQYAVTGDATLNPYTLWWPYDKIGFGPGYGHTQTGHTWKLAKINTRFSLFVGWHDLFGWGDFSWIFLPFGLIALFTRRAWKALLAAAVFPCLVFVYLFYWIGSSLFGPRYYFEGLYSLTILSAAGIAFLAGWPLQAGINWMKYSGWRKIRPLLITAVIALLMSVNLLFYLPIRLKNMHGLYDITRSRLQPFQTPQAQQVAPALVVVHPNKWTEYGALLELETPLLDTPFIFVLDGSEKTITALAQVYPQRNVIHYYPAEPYVFYRAKR